MTIAQQAACCCLISLIACYLATGLAIVHTLYPGGAAKPLRPGNKTASSTNASKVAAHHAHNHSQLGRSIAHAPHHPDHAHHYGLLG